jgi:MFS family permease
MSTRSASVSEPSSSLNQDFWKFWIGQAISSLGSSFTLFALPLLTFKLTNSALNLAFTTVAGFLPYLLFGLLIGAWVDRVNRKRLMIATDIMRAVVIASIPLLAHFHLLSFWWIYVVTFTNTTLAIGFNAAQFAAIPSLVSRDKLVAANGHVQASTSAATIIGPFLAALLLTFIPVTALLFFDALSFLVSALFVALIKTNFNQESRPKKNIWQDIAEGVGYVLTHPVLRAIAIMMALVNLVSMTTSAQLVLFAKEQLAASDTQVALFYSAGSIGIVLFSLLAGFLRKRWPFSVVALGALTLNGLFTIALSFMHWYWAALAIWAVIPGLGMLFNINTNSLRQAIVPNNMLGRVMTVASVMAWSAIPLGTLIGGVIIDQLKNIGLVYGIIGGLTVLLPLTFAFTALGHAERYLPTAETSPSSRR